MPARTSVHPAAPLPRLVLFDMDDTLFDHALTCRDALARVREETGFFRGRSIDELWGEYGRLLDETHTDVMLGRRTADDVRSDRFVRLAAWSGQPIDRETAAGLSRDYREHYQRLRRAVPGAPEAVRRLTGRVQVGVVTNNTVAEQVEKLAFLGLDRTVELLVTSEEVGVAKPDPAIFRAALDRAGAAPQDAVMVGDSWASDVVGARAADIRAIWFNRFREAQPRPPRVSEFSTFRATRRFERLLLPPKERTSVR